MHFVTCFFGQLLTNDLMQVGDIVYHMSWYEYPNDVNRFVRIIMTFSRQPIYFKGLKITVCSLASFGSVRARGFGFASFTWERLTVF